MQTYKLGRKAPRLDPRTLRLEKYILPGLPPAPATVTWSNKLTSIGMMLNDEIGDCTCATAGHMIQTWTANDAPRQITIPDAEVLRAYSAVSGYDPRTGANDDGAVVLDVLKYWRSIGIGGRRIGGFASVTVRNTTLIKQANYLFGGVYLGVTITQLSMDQAGAGRPWTTPTWYDRITGRTRVIGGHAVPLVDADPQGLTVLTWGQKQRASWGWFAAYCQESFAVLSTDWTNEDARAPNGFDLKTLQKDLGLVTR